MRAHVVQFISRIRRWASIGLGLFVFFPFPLLAAEVEFDLQPRALQLGESAVVRFTVRGVSNPPVPALPPIDGFQARYAGSEQSFSFGTGGRNQSVSFKFQLTPTKTGSFTIGPFNYQVDGKTHPLPAVAVEVVASNQAADQGGQAGQTQLSDLLFARFELPDGPLYNQQVFDLVVSLYSRQLNMERDVSILNLPDSGFTLEQLRELGAAREVVNGQIFDVRRLRTRVHALTAGTFNVAPVVQVALRVPRQTRRRRSRFDGFFDGAFSDMLFGGTERRQVNISVKPFDIVVRPLPADSRPAGFSGAVGSFSFDVSVSPVELRVGDPITVRSVISGDGNVDAVSAPEILLGDDFKVYEAKLVNKDGGAYGQRMKKIFEQVIIPKSDEIEELPALGFSYFDPEKGAYQTVERGPFQLNLQPAPEGSLRIVQGDPSLPAGGNRMLGRDIVYLKAEPSRWQQLEHRSWFATPIFIAFQVAPPVVLAVLLLTVRRRTELQRDVAKARRLRAPRSARAAVKKAEHALSNSNRTAFYEGLWDALSSYFGDRLNLPPGGVTADAVLEAMRTDGLSPEDGEALQRLFEESERARFGLGTASDGEQTEQMRILLDDLGRLLRVCERVRK